MTHGFTVLLTLFSPNSSHLLTMLCLSILTGHSTTSTCYGNAQIECFDEFTELVASTKGQQEANVSAICQTFLELQRCVDPKVQDCDPHSKQQYTNDIIDHMTGPPYYCPRNRFDGAKKKPSLGVRSQSVAVVVYAVIIGLIHLIT